MPSTYAATIQEITFDRLGWLPTLMQYILFCRQCIFRLQMSHAFYVGVASQLVNVLKLLADGFIYASRLIEIRYGMWMFRRSLQSVRRRSVKTADTTPSEFLRYVNETSETRQNQRRRSENEFAKRYPPPGGQRRSSKSVHFARSSDKRPAAPPLLSQMNKRPY
ncbi:Protein F10D7.1 [Aphelenchoides avenae]|nr:Protein F10D7.1 [Aphelenchus avenae]